MEFFRRLFDTSDFPPRWHCGLWTSGHGWLHILSDLGVWSAYVAIPCVLGYFILRRRDLPFRSIFVLFGAFILACGTTHLMEAIIFWWPAYRLAGLIKLFTAIVSWTTVIALIPIVPRVLALRSPQELEREVNARTRAEEALALANRELEERITERTAELSEANSQLQLERERIRTTLASIGDAVITTDAHGKITFLNDVAQTLTGWSSQDAVGMNLETVFNIVNEDTRHPVDNPATQALQKGVVVGLANHTVLICRDGSERPIDDSAAPIRADDGHLLGCVLVFRDVNERRSNERAVRLSEERMRIAQRVAQIGTFEWNIQTGVNQWTPELEAMYGLEPGSFSGTLQAWESLVHPDDLSHATEHLQQAIEEGEFADEWRVIWPNGETRWLAARGSVFKDAGGKPLRLVGVNIDITERKEMEEALQESEARYRAIGESIDFGVWICDAQGRNVYASESFLRLVGITQKECSEFGWGTVLHPDDVEDTIREWKACVSTQGVWDREHRFEGVDGNWHYVLARGVPVKNDIGKLLGWAGINLDISRLKQAEGSLREADRRKDEFLATLAHELRNPLAPVRNAVEILRVKGQAIPELQWARDVIDRQMQAMSRLIDDLMDVSRISRNKLELRLERVSLASVLQAAIETSRPLIEQHQHDLAVDIPEETIMLDADLTRLAQVFLNLLNNAAKYTEPGGRIGVAAERQGRDVVVTIKDTGIGIAREKLPTIFDMFSQLEGSLKRSQGGLGIGLSLVKRLVEMHGGYVDANSGGVGHGSEFIVRLPIVIEGNAQHSARVDGTAKPRPSNLRILVVDDNRDAAESTAMLLKLMGNTVRIANDGDEAVTAAAEFAPGVILLDIGLPKKNGYEVAQSIRQEDWGRDIRIIAVTGWGQEDDRRRSKEAGFDWHMVKPIDPQDLMKLLAELPQAPARSDL